MDHGRVDDVINVSATAWAPPKLKALWLNTKPALKQPSLVSHTKSGQGIFAYVILNQGFEESEELAMATEEMV